MPTRLSTPCPAPGMACNQGVLPYNRSTISPLVVIAAPDVRTAPGKSEVVEVVPTRKHPGNAPLGTAVMACEDESLPLQARIETAADDADLEEVDHTARHRLSVAYTRARDHLLVTSVDPPSEFLDDLRM